MFLDGVERGREVDWQKLVHKRVIGSNKNEQRIGGSSVGLIELLRAHGMFALPKDCCSSSIIMQNLELLTKTKCMIHAESQL